MGKSSNIPQFTQTRILCKEQSEIKLSKFVAKYNEKRKYGERIISSQVNTVKTIITELATKLRHRLTTGKRFHITLNTLADMCQCSVKTCYNHIQRLIDAGILRKRQTTHKFRETDIHYTPCLLIEVSLEILHFLVTNVAQEVEKFVDKVQLTLPAIPKHGQQTLIQLGIFEIGDFHTM